MPEVSISPGVFLACLDASAACEQWLSDITDTHCSTTGPRPSDWRARFAVSVCASRALRTVDRGPSIIGSGSRPCPYVLDSGDAPPAENSLDSMFHKQGRDSKSFKPLNVVIAGPNKPHSVYFTGV